MPRSYREGGETRGGVPPASLKPFLTDCAWREFGAQSFLQGAGPRQIFRWRRTTKGASILPGF